MRLQQKINNISSKISHFILYLFLLVAACPGTIYGNDVSISAALSTTSLSIDSTAILTLTVHGAKSARVELPDIDELTLHYRGSSSKMQVINGEITSSITYTYIVEPLKEGTTTIPPFSVEVKRKKYTTQPLSLEILPEGEDPEEELPSAGKDSVEENYLAFLKINGLKDKAYTGQLIPIEIKGYFLQGARVEIQSLPKLRGEDFVLSPLVDEPKQSVEQVNGKNYSVITWNTACSPIKEGDHQFSMSLEAVVLVPKRTSRQPRGRHPFFDDDAFFDSFFGSIERKNVKLKNPPTSITIAALPEEGKPEQFNGAIGNFFITATAQPLKIEVGDPITLTMTISGKGNFDRVNSPTFPAGDGWKTYSPTSYEEISKSGYQGKKIFEQAIVVRDGAIDAIPPLQFSFFDPQKEKYITRETKQIPLQIEGGMEPETQDSQPVPPQTETIEQEPTSSTQTLPIQLTLGKFSRDIKPIYKQVWYLCILFSCLIILLGIFIYSLRNKYRSNNLQAIQKKTLHRQILKLFDKIDKSMEANNDVEFMQGCRNIIRQHLAHEWQVEPSTITSQDLEKRLTTSSPLKPIFQLAEQQAYASISLNRDEMQEIASTLKNELEG